MKFKVEVEREEDGRWIAEVNELPGVLVYGDSVEQAQAKAQALALRVLADRLENGEAAPFESALAQYPASSLDWGRLTGVRCQRAMI